MAAQGHVAAVPGMITGMAPGGVASRELSEAAAARSVESLDWAVVERRLDAVVFYGTAPDTTRVDRLEASAFLRETMGP